MRVFKCLGISVNHKVSMLKLSIFFKSLLFDVNLNPAIVVDSDSVDCVQRNVYGQVCPATNILGTYTGADLEHIVQE